MYALACVVAFLCVVGFTLCLAGAIENRAVRRDPMWQLAASSKFTGRAWSAAEFSTPAATRRAVGVESVSAPMASRADRGRGALLLGHPDRNLSGQSRDAHRNPILTPRLSAPRTARESDLTGSRNTNARAPGAGVR